VLPCPILPRYKPDPVRNCHLTAVCSGRRRLDRISRGVRRSSRSRLFLARDLGGRFVWRRCHKLLATEYFGSQLRKAQTIRALAILLQQIRLSLRGLPSRLDACCAEKMRGVAIARHALPATHLDSAQRGHLPARKSEHKSMLMCAPSGEGRSRCLKSTSSWNTDAGCGAIGLVSRDTARFRLHNPR
jgi:hypothetical protein